MIKHEIKLPDVLEFLDAYEVTSMSIDIQRNTMMVGPYEVRVKDEPRIEYVKFNLQKIINPFEKAHATIMYKAINRKYNVNEPIIITTNYGSNPVHVNDMQAVLIEFDTHKKILEKIKTKSKLIMPEGIPCLNYPIVDTTVVEDDY